MGLGFWRRREDLEGIPLTERVSNAKWYGSEGETELRQNASICFIVSLQGSEENHDTTFKFTVWIFMLFVQLL